MRSSDQSPSLAQPIARHVLEEAQVYCFEIRSLLASATHRIYRACCPLSALHVVVGGVIPLQSTLRSLRPSIPPDSMLNAWVLSTCGLSYAGVGGGAQGAGIPHVGSGSPHYLPGTGSNQGASACLQRTACWLVACAHVDSEHRCDTEESFGMSTGHVRRTLISVTMFVITPTPNGT